MLLTLGFALLALGSGSVAESDQEVVQAAALKHYLAQNPSEKAICLAVGGYKAPSKSLRSLLRGVNLDKNEKCHFREGALVYSLTRAVFTSEGLAELEVSRLEFGDVSTRTERVLYKLEKAKDWQVVSAVRAVQ